MDLNGLNLPAGLHIRPSAPSDKPFMEQLYKSTREDLDFIADQSGDFIEFVKEQQQEAQIEGYGDQFPNAMYFVIEYHHEKVGRAVLDFGMNEIRVVDLAFIKEARGKGLGEGVMASFVSISEKVKAPLVLSVLSSNVAAKMLYAKLGFVVESIEFPREYLAYYPSSQGIRT